MSSRVLNNSEYGRGGVSKGRGMLIGFSNKEIVYNKAWHEHLKHVSWPREVQGPIIKTVTTIHCVKCCEREDSAGAANAKKCAKFPNFIPV